MARTDSKKRKIQEQQFPSVNKRSSSSSRLKEKADIVSQAQMVKLTYEYTIAELSLLPQKTGERVHSPTFKAKSHPDMRWKLTIYPNGEDKDSKGHLGLYLHRCNLTTEVDSAPVAVYYKFTVLMNEEELKCFAPQKPRLFTTSTNNWGLRKFLSVDQLKCEGINELKIVCTLIYEGKRNWITTFFR